MICASILARDVWAKSRSACLPVWISRKIAGAVCFGIALLVVASPAQAQFDSFLNDARRAFQRQLDFERQRWQQQQQAQPQSPASRRSSPTGPSYSRDQVAEIQSLLNELGYDAGTVDGVLGINTRAAIAAYQRDNGYAATGRIDDSLLPALRVSSAGAQRAPDATVSEDRRLPAHSATPEQPRHPPAAAAAAAPSPAQPRQSQPAATATASPPADSLVIVVPKAARTASPDLPPLPAAQTLASGSEGLVICSAFDPVEAVLKNANTFLAQEGAAAPLRRVLEERNSPAADRIRPTGRAPNFVRLHPIAYLDRSISSRDGRDVGVYGESIGIEKFAKHCKLVQAFSVCEEASGDLRNLLKCDVSAAASSESQPSATDIKPAEKPSRKPGRSSLVVGTQAAARSGATPPPAPAEPPAAAVETQDTRILRPDFDPTVPEGVAIAMKGADAERRLLAAGYRPKRDRFVRDEGRNTYEASYETKYFDAGGPGDLVYRYRYKIDAPAPEGSVPGVVKTLSAKIGAEPDCSILEDNLAQCSWEAPPDAPLLLKVSFNAQIRRERLEIEIRGEAVRDLPLRLAGAPAFSVDKDSFDPLAPMGAKIGISRPQAEEAAAQHGFMAKGDPCEFTPEGDPNPSMRINVTTKSAGQSCVDDKPVSFVSFQVSETRVEGGLLDLVSRLDAAVGQAGDCRTREEGQIRCTWMKLPGQPLIRQLNLLASRSYMQLDLYGVYDIEKQVKIAKPAPAAPVPISERPWWVQELAKMEQEARGSKFTPVAAIASLDAGKQSQVSKEAGIVYDYCKSRELFATLFDCRCVASKVAEKRITDGLVPLGDDDRSIQQKLVAMGDKVSLSCPNKPGVANDAYNTCMGNYADNKEYCTCYAEVKTQAFMNEPSGYMPRLTGYGAFALTECDRRGLLRKTR